MTEPDQTKGRIRACDLADAVSMLAIINAAAGAYRRVIPADRWHEPYMPAGELVAEIADGVTFSGYEAGGELVGVMGVQRRRNVDLIRHAYVIPVLQGHGIGSGLLRHLCQHANRPILVGTWAAAELAIRFYERHEFTRVRDSDIAPLLQTYWNVPDRQMSASVVLSSPPIDTDAVHELISRVQAV